MWNQQPFLKSDVESGSGEPLYPMMLESTELRWSFIRKIYSIVAIQLLLTAVVGAIVVSYHPIVNFLTTTNVGFACYILLIIAPFITLCPLSYYYQRHPVNYLLLGIFTITLASAVGLTCAFTSGKVILEAVILTATVVVSLTLFTFWAAKRGYDFNFLGPFLFGAVMELSETLLFVAEKQQQGVHVQLPSLPQSPHTERQPMWRPRPPPYWSSPFAHPY
ncbi:Bax inhibitor 1-related protein [Cynara cardunculus var. scolymus]|uniref:Bax inhibitor 1-related protein n=1 Tax=Cynara cardunculus var. scolymus TaxID=59895 RepID=A0A103Y7G2_CYNCS|nr:Bax inhibitor 1-related protein [Cynara cardunculus var. scolymus]